MRSPVTVTTTSYTISCGEISVSLTIPYTNEQGLIFRLLAIGLELPEETLVNVHQFCEGNESAGKCTNRSSGGTAIDITQHVL